MHIVGELLPHLLFIFGRFGYTSSPCLLTNSLFYPVSAVNYAALALIVEPLGFLPHVPNHLSYVCLAFLLFMRFFLGMDFSLSLVIQTGKGELGGRTNLDGRTNKRTKQRHPRRSDFGPARLVPGLGWIEHQHLYAYYILFTTYYLISRSESKEGGKGWEAIQARSRFRDSGV